jgi:hypothetical protein
MQQKVGTCKQCEKENRYINSRFICSDCTYQNNHNGKTMQQVTIEKQKLKESKQIKRTVRKPLKQKFKNPTGERDLFLEIWKEREHICSNKDCRKYLGDEPCVQYFSHIKSKGAYPELRLDKSNIEILCGECHYQEEFGTKIKR